MPVGGGAFRGIGGGNLLFGVLHFVLAHLGCFAQDAPMVNAFLGSHRDFSPMPQR